MYNLFSRIFAIKCGKYSQDELDMWLLEQLAKEAAAECAACEKYGGLK